MNRKRRADSWPRLNHPCGVRIPRGVWRPKTLPASLPRCSKRGLKSVPSLKSVDDRHVPLPNLRPTTFPDYHAPQEPDRRVPRCRSRPAGRFVWPGGTAAQQRCSIPHCSGPSPASDTNFQRNGGTPPPDRLVAVREADRGAVRGEGIPRCHYVFDIHEEESEEPSAPSLREQPAAIGYRVVMAPSPAKAPPAVPRPVTPPPPRAVPTPTTPPPSAAPVHDVAVPWSSGSLGRDLTPEGAFSTAAHSRNAATSGAFEG
jgi:hypothetical protein